MGRRVQRLDEGKEILQETRHWDEATQTTAGGRLSKLENVLQRQSHEEDVQNHLKFAIEHHKKKIQVLEDRLK